MVVQKFALDGLMPPLHLPGVVGDRILVNKCSIPFLRQIRSNNASAGRGRPYFPVNWRPLSVSTCSGIPNSVNAATNAAQTARPVARPTTAAITAYRE